LLIGYLLMRSEDSSAESIQGMISFSSHLTDGNPISISTAKCIINKNLSFLHLTQERSMTKARTDPITIDNTDSFIRNWEFALNHNCVPLDHLINADESLFRAQKDDAVIT